MHMSFACLNLLPLALLLQEHFSASCANFEVICRFTPLSDMYSIGVLLREALVGVSTQALTFIQKLMDKELTAEAALTWLQHEWSQ